MHYYKKIKTRHSETNLNVRYKRKVKQLKRFVKYVRYKQSFIRFNAEYLKASLMFLGKARNVHAEKFLLRVITWIRIFLFKHNLKFA